MNNMEFTSEEKEMAINELAKRVAIDDLIARHPGEYYHLVHIHLAIIKGKSENKVGADDNDE